MSDMNERQGLKTTPPLLVGRGGGMPPGINVIAFSLTGAKDVSPSLAILIWDSP